MKFYLTAARHYQTPHQEAVPSPEQPLSLPKELSRSDSTPHSVVLTADCPEGAWGPGGGKGRVRDWETCPPLGWERLGLE
jgi:hypothetical protein